MIIRFAQGTRQVYIKSMCSATCTRYEPGNGFVCQRVSLIPPNCQSSFRMEQQLLPKDDCKAIQEAFCRFFKKVADQGLQGSPIFSLSIYMDDGSVEIKGQTQKVLVKSAIKTKDVSIYPFIKSFKGVSARMGNGYPFERHKSDTLQRWFCSSVFCLSRGLPPLPGHPPKPEIYYYHTETVRIFFHVPSCIREYEEYVKRVPAINILSDIMAGNSTAELQIIIDYAYDGKETLSILLGTALYQKRSSS